MLETSQTGSEMEILTPASEPVYRTGEGEGEAEGKGEGDDDGEGEGSSSKSCLTPTLSTALLTTC